MSDSPTPDNPPARSRGRGSRGGRRPYARIDHRARSHEEAHAEYAEEASAPEPEASAGRRHPLVPVGTAELITTDSQLQVLLEHLRSVGSFAYDSEFIGELTYYPKLCLVQVASSEKVALIDPLAGVELRPFWELLCDEKVEKIVHAGQQDIEPVVRHLGRGPVNVFDTQIAAGMAALPYPVSLSKLVYELAGARLGKGLTFTHWDQRPLSGMQLRYAADDVRYLPRVRREIGRRLETLGHTEWARQECAAQCEPSLYGFNPQTQYLRVRGAGSLHPRNVAVLRELTIWRDAAARQHDLPPRTFLRDEILVDLARSPVKGVEQLSRIRGLPRPVEAAHGPAIVEATRRAMALAAPELPAVRDYEPLPAEKFSGDALFYAAQCLCAARGIDPALVGSRQDFGDFYQRLQNAGGATGGGKPRAPETLEALAGLKVFKGWRREAAGQPLLEMVSGGRGFGLRWVDGAMRLTETAGHSALAAG